MSWYILENHAYVEDDLYLLGTLYSADLEKVRNIFKNGTKLQESLKTPLSLVVNETDTIYGNITDRINVRFAGAGRGFLFHKRIIDIFRQLGIKNVEFFEVKIKGKKLNEDNFVIMNLVDKIDCIDADNSVIEYDGEFVDVIEKLVIDEAKVGGRKIFNFAGHPTILCVIHKEIKLALERNRFTGVRCIPVEDYTKEGL